MEGFIPLVYKSLKNKTRRKYECLSAGAADSYNIADFYIDNQDYLRGKHESENDKVSGLTGTHYRRYNSVHVDRVGSFGFREDATYKREQLVRFRSHRMFSCVTGA